MTFSKTKILIVSAGLEIGGIERSLLGLLYNLDYDRYQVDLLLYRQCGPFMEYLPKEGPRLLDEIQAYATFQRPILSILREGYVRFAAARLLAKSRSLLDGWQRSIVEPGYLVRQRSWRYATSCLPAIPGSYDLAVSFMVPHYLVTDSVQARVKAGWIHTDYSSIPTDGHHEAEMWGKLDYLVAVSEECRKSFLDRFPHLASKTMVIENILSPELIRKQALEFEVKEEIPREPGLTRILSVGRLSHAKGIDTAVLACREMLDQGYNIRWYVVGYGPDEKNIRQLIASKQLEDSFIILGQKVNPYPYMKECDIYVQPSRYEGKAVTVREAQVLGKPVMITRYPTSASQVREGVDGHVCEMGVDGIVAGIRRLIDAPDFCKRLALNSLGSDYSGYAEVEKIYRLLH